MTEFAVVQFIDDTKVKKVVPVSFIRQSKGGAFVPSCLQDVPRDAMEVKWQKSDLGTDGYFPAKIICLGGTTDAAIASAKNLGHKLSSDCVMKEPLKTKLDSPLTTKNKGDRKTRAAVKRTAPDSSEACVQKKKTKSIHSQNKGANKQRSKEPKKKAPNNRLAADPIVASRLKESMAAAMRGNPVIFEHLRKAEDVEGPSEVVSPQDMNEEESPEDQKKAESHQNIEDSDECNTTVEVSSPKHSNDECSSDDSGSSSSGSSSGDDPVCKLSEVKKKLEDEVHSLKLENKDLKTQLAMVWSEHKSKVDLQKQAEAKLENLKEELRKEKDKNSALQDALVLASNARSVARTLHFGDKSPVKANSSNRKTAITPPPLRNEDKSCSPSPSNGSSSHSSSPAWKVDELGDGEEDCSVKLAKVSKPSSKDLLSSNESSGKKKSGKKYIENNASAIDTSCKKILGFLNKAEKPCLDKDGNGKQFLIGNGTLFPSSVVLFQSETSSRMENMYHSVKENIRKL